MRLLIILVIIAGFGFSSTAFGISENKENLESQVSLKLNESVPFEIKFDEIIQYKDLKIKFAEIEDSRCPSNVTCVWEGQAKVLLQIFLDSEEYEIIFVTSEKTSDYINQYKFILIDILPYPTSTSENLEKDYVVSVSIMQEEMFDSSTFPLQQIKNGIPLTDVACDIEKIKVYKHNLLRLACVSETNADKLVERGWALSTEEHNNLDESSLTSEVFILPQFDNTKFNVQPKIINGQKFLVMQGSNWNYSKDIEITILGEFVQTKIIKTRTNNNGQFYMSWGIPNDFQSGQYDVKITDGIKNKSEKVTILGLTNEIHHLGPGYQVIIEGDKEVRRGTTHNIEVSVYKDQIPVQGARIFLDIEDYGEDRIREFEGWTDPNGKFVYSWEIPRSFDDIETLLAFIGVVHGDFSRTEIFKFVVYCLPGEEGCQIDGN